jgi:hypothetical protein
MCPYYLDGDLTELVRVRSVIPVATRAYRVRVAVATVQFSRAAERAVMPAVEHGGCDGGRRSLKTQQHARARARRYASLARPGSVDVLGRAVGNRPIPSPARRLRVRGRRRAVRAPVLVLPRKEVIQPHLPVRLPCYDFTPVTSPTFDGSLPCGLGHRLRVLLTPVV